MVAALLAVAAGAHAADVEQMLGACRARAATVLHAAEDGVVVKYEGQRTDKTHAVNGSLVAQGRETSIQCSFDPGGARSARFVVNQPKPAAASPPAVATAEPAAAVLGQAVRAALQGDFEAHYFDACVDLDGDGRSEVVVHAAGPMICGTGGCNLDVFAPEDGGYRLVSTTSVTKTPVRLSPRSSRGWRNLIVHVGGGGMAPAEVELEFDGSRHPGNPTVPPVASAPSLDDALVLIPQFDSYRDGRPVPPWRL